MSRSADRVRAINEQIDRLQRKVKEKHPNMARAKARIKELKLVLKDRETS